GGQAGMQLFVTLALIALGLVAWRWATREGTYKNSLRHVAGAGIGLLAMLFAFVAIISLSRLASQEHAALPRSLSFLAPVQQSGSALTLEVANVEDGFSVWDRLGHLWPALLAMMVWVYSLATERVWLRGPGVILGW